MRTKLDGSIYFVDDKEYLCVIVDGEACMTVKQLAVIVNYTTKTIRKKIDNGTIPSTKRPNGRVLIKVSDVERLISEGAFIKNISA